MNFNSLKRTTIIPITFVSGVNSQGSVQRRVVHTVSQPTHVLMGDFRDERTRSFWLLIWLLLNILFLDYLGAPSTLMHFRLKTHTFRCVIAYRHKHYKDGKRWSFSSKTHTFENAIESVDIWKRSPVVLVSTAKTEAFENADAIRIT